MEKETVLPQEHTAENPKGSSTPHRFAKAIGFLHTPAFLRLMIVFFACLLISIMFIISISPQRYDLHVGDVCPVDIKVPESSWEDSAATHQKRLEAESKVKTTYIRNDEIMDDILAHFDRIVKQLNLIVNEFAPSLEGYGEKNFSTEDIEGAQAYLLIAAPETEEGEEAAQPEAREAQYIVQMSSAQLRRLMREDPNTLRMMYSALRKRIQNAKITEDSRTDDITSIIDDSFSYSTLDDKLLFTQIGRPILNACIQPNYIIDHEKLEREKQEARESVAPVIYKYGQEILKEGDIVGQEQYDLLNEHGMLKSSDINLSLNLGSILMCIFILGAGCVLLYAAAPTLSGDTTRVSVCAIVCVITFLLCVLAKRIHPYLAPVMLSAMLLTAITGMRSGIIISTFITLLTAMLSVNSMHDAGMDTALFILCNIASASLCVIIMKGRSTRLRALFCVPAICVCDALLSLAYGLITNVSFSSTLVNCGWLAAGGVASVLLVIAMQPLLELLFNLPTPMKLMELSNPNHPLLRKLLLEAPGTYHHSLLVANLAQAAAEAIGANPLLARVSGYYHDVGKLKRPLFFKENQIGEENAHDHTDPQVSAAILTAHPGDGVEIARKYRLPRVVLQNIACHHGNTPVMFFYHKALQQAGGKPVDIANFRYNAQPPTTKEGAIILLCDTIEAAVRSMKQPTPEEIEAFIEQLIRGKLEDGQLSHCPLTLEDIDKIGNACTTVLQGVFHERIEYPKMPETQTQQKHEPAAPESDPAHTEEAEPASQENAADAKAETPAESSTDQPVSSAVPDIANEKKAVSEPCLLAPQPEKEPECIQLVAPEKETAPTVCLPEAALSPMVLDNLLKGPSLTEVAEISDPSRIPDKAITPPSADDAANDGAAAEERPG